VERLGRRPLFLFSFAGMLVTYVIWTILSAINQQRNFEDKSLGGGVLAMIFLYYFCYGAGLNGLPILYFTEILPYSLRALGMNVFNIMTVIVLVYNGFVNPIAMDAIQWKYYIVWDCVLAVELVIAYFFYPETKGHTLETVGEVFGDEVAHIDDEIVEHVHSEKV
jgi:MFS family permease